MMFESLFQSFDDPPTPPPSGARIMALREQLVEHGLAGVVIPRADQHQNEYVPPSDERLAWISGFTGSAGFAAILTNEAALFVDGRYTLQAAQQADPAQWTIEPLADPPPEEWIATHLNPGERLGFDPWLHTPAAADRLEKACARAGATLVPLTANLVDAIWLDRPKPPHAPIILHDLRFAGEEAATKLAAIREDLKRGGIDAFVMSDPHAVAWTFNIRGSDIPHTPIALIYAIVPANERAILFVDVNRIDDATRESLLEQADLAPPSDFVETLTALGKRHSRVGLDKATAAEAIRRLVAESGGTVVSGVEPVALRKAIKNETEIAGSRAAHLRDAVALVRCLAWIDREALHGHLTEIDVVEALETFRRETGQLRDVSFPTICGSGPNGAIVHYRVTRASNRRIHPGELLLLDSGAQYEDGTTDVTRTIAIGHPADEMRERFTRVLKGHIAIARAVFPDGTSGAQLDSFARQFLWQAGLDFDHGTGHGVGSYLSVHEGPARISKLGTTPLKRGMILSNEPGYYKTGAFGIRIENLVLVKDATIDGAERPMNDFETLTLAPIDLRLVDLELLSMNERDWLNAYHQRVHDALTQIVDNSTRIWLSDATRAI